MVPMKRALRLVIDGKAEIVEADHDRLVRSERLTIPRPAVIRLTRFVHVPRRFRRHVTNTFLFARDQYRCQYCGRHMTEFKPREALTRDHLVPLSRGGTNDWTNVTTACSPCNTRKGNRLPEEIGMHPLTHPIEPHFVHLSWAVRRLTPIQARYIRTFYGDQVLHQLEALEQRMPEPHYRELRHAEPRGHEHKPHHGDAKHHDAKHHDGKHHHDPRHHGRHH
ncbi:MAG TPA: HNH endonuclease [Gemmatimonadaceae bacterium]|nr:HNH endonuclease [Gemmatimonadaceae bacterium]